MSALPPIADIRQCIKHLRFVPKAEILSPNRASDSSGDISHGIAGLVAVGSDNSAICTEYLAVDPGAVGGRRGKQRHWQYLPAVRAARAARVWRADRRR